ncbi:MAG: helix-turn-helix transcriptional regulator [Herbiconiux sp.]|nr:helix-turn-helix transcriptional regulator [Herbiconiux sp.]
MDQSGGAGESVAAPLRAAMESADWETVQFLVGRNWSALIIDDPQLIRDAVTALPDHVVADNPRWITAQNYLNYLPVGDAPRPLRFRDNAPPRRSEALIDVLVELTSRGAAARSSGRIDRAVQWVDQARATLDDATEESRVELQFSLPDLHSQWGKVREHAGQTAAALAEFQDAHDLAVLTGNELIQRSAAGSLAWLHTLAGRTAEAQAWLGRVPLGTEAAPGATPDWTSKRYGMAAHLSRAYAHLDRLEYAEALEVLVAYADVSKAPEYWAVMLYLRAHLSRFTRDPMRILTNIDSAVESRPTDMSTRGTNAVFVAAARAGLNLDLDRAQLARQALAAVQEGGAPAVAASAGHIVQVAQAQVELLSGDLPAVGRLVDEMITQSTAAPRAVAKAFVLSAAAQLRAGDEAGAGRSFGRAIEQISGSGLLGAFTVITRRDFDALVRLGAGTCGREGLRMLDDVAERGLFLPELVPAAPLTPRERSVLRELASGDSLADIAARLFVSQNTVKSQLRSAYRKLGVASRAEAEARAARLGLL